ncbi:hypothetical protein QJQ45_004946 [Haematococcus lacustris]|nr:hypothetical protein QJQ45_004946 [Haematococcus lacustris]
MHCTAQELNGAGLFSLVVSSVSAVKKKLEKERELDGMDMGNIISTSSRPRRATAAVNYKAVLEQLKSPGSDEEEDGEQEEEKGGRPAKAKAGSKKGKKPVKKEGQEDSSEGSGSEGGGEEEEEEEEEGGASDSGSASDSESDFESPPLLVPPQLLLLLLEPWLVCTAYSLLGIECCGLSLTSPHPTLPG